MTREQILAAIAALQAMLDSPEPQVGPDEVWLPKTARAFPRPRPDLGEMFIGYVQRVGKALSLDTSGVGSLFLGTAHLGDVRNSANWPEMADRYFDPRAYMTAEQIAAEQAAQLHWQEVGQKIQDRVATERERAKGRRLNAQPGEVDVPIGTE